MPSQTCPNSPPISVYKVIKNFYNPAVLIVLLCSSCATPPPQPSVAGNDVEQAQFDQQLKRYPTIMEVKAQPSGFVPSVVLKLGIPKYPYAMSKSQQIGKVWFEIYVEPSGEVHEVHILKSTNSAFEEPAISALKESKFRPALLNGSPVRTSALRSVMEFNLD